MINKKIITKWATHNSAKIDVSDKKIKWGSQKTTVTTLTCKCKNRGTLWKSKTV